MNRDLFYVDRGRYPEEVVQACKVCPVSGPCLENALEFDQPGYIAGTTQVQRKERRRNRDGSS